MHVWKCRGVLRPLLMIFLSVSIAARLHANPDAAAIGSWLRQDQDFTRTPALRAFVLDLVDGAPKTLREADPDLLHLLRDIHAAEDTGWSCLHLTREDTWRFLRACAQDRITMLRAIGLVSRLVRRGNIGLVVDGADLTSGMREQRLSDGLSIPSEHALLYVYIPDPNLPEPFQCRFLALYDRPFTHTYPETPACAPVVIGADADLRLGPRRLLASRPVYARLYRIGADLRYDTVAVGLFNVQGLGLAGIKSMLGSVSAMYAQDRSLVLETSRFHARRRIPGFEAPENAGTYAIHAQ